MTTATRYNFESTTTATYGHNSGGSNKRRGGHHRRVGSDNLSAGGDSDAQDGSGSLTYSAASSINSATGESTDSSFADIMKVLDIQDSSELAAYLRKEAVRQGKDERSVAESLAYSTDAESHFRSLATDGESALHGADLLSTLTG